MEEYPTEVSALYPTQGDRIPTPSRPMSEGVKSNVLTSKFDSGFSQSRIKGEAKRTFDLNYISLSLDQYKTIRDFYMRVMTCYSFTWVHPIEKTTHTVKFTNELFKGTNKGHGPKGPTYELSVTLEEI